MLELQSVANPEWSIVQDTLESAPYREEGEEGRTRLVLSLFDQFLEVTAHPLSRR